MTGSDEGADLPDILLPELPDSPYPGLRPFEKREWPIFFGRERMTDEVVERLLRRRLVIVHGASGSGKSSLVRAGVQARLEQQHSRSELRWRTCAMRPGRSPLGNLAEALAGVGDGLRGPPTIEIRRALNRGRRAPEAIRALLRISEADRVCILLDQFEELFRFADEVSRDEASLLTDFLAAFQEAPPVGMYLLVTMRSEFLGECAGFDGLAETVNHTQYLLPRMETQDLLRAVREPAELYDGRVSERLAERLIADARAGQDELPLIQHGLLRLWVFSADPGGGKPRRALDLPEYETRGPLSRLLSDHADGVVDEAAEDAAGQTQIEELFRALTDTNAAGQATRRPQRFGDLVPVTGSSRDRRRSILIDLREPGVSFITPFPPAPIGEDTTIDISHEALIRRWERIASPNDGWLQQEFRDGLIWRALVVQADSFAADPRNVLSEATTEARTEWIKGRNAAWAERYGGRWALVGELLIASQKDIERRREQAARERERAEELKLAQERRAAAESLLAERDKRIAAEQELALRRGRQLRIALITAVVTLGLALVAGWEWRTAEMLRGIAQQQAVIASTQRAMADEAAAAANKLARELQVSATSLQTAKANAESALQAEQTANSNLQAALERASKTQSAAAIVAKTISADSADAAPFSRLMNALENSTDPYQIAVVGQSVVSFSDALSPSEINEIVGVLVRELDSLTDNSAVDAIGQALLAIARVATAEQAEAAQDNFSRGLESAKTPDQALSLAAALRLLSSKNSEADRRLANQETARALAPFASRLKPEQAGIALGYFTDGLKAAESSEQIKSLVTAIQNIPGLPKTREVLAALSELNSINSMRDGYRITLLADLLEKSLSEGSAKPAAVNYLLCVGDDSSRSGHCPAEAVVLPCGSSVANWAKSNNCPSMVQTQSSFTRGGRCGYYVIHVECTHSQ